jgi:cell division protein FtsL
MIRALNIVLVLGVIVLAIGLYDIKYKAEIADKRVQSLQHDIASEQESIRVLRAEWSYLNQPERLQELARRYTKLEPMQASQIGRFADVPLPHKADDFYAPTGRKPLGGYAGVTPQDLGSSARTIR